jgi:hypothetical protein
MFLVQLKAILQHFAWRNLGFGLWAEIRIFGLRIGNVNYPEPAFGEENSWRSLCFNYISLVGYCFINFLLLRRWAQSVILFGKLRITLHSFLLSIVLKHRHFIPFP